MKQNITITPDQLLLEDFFDCFDLTQLENDLKEMYISTTKDESQDHGFNLENKAFMIDKLMSLLKELNKNLN